MPKIGFYCRSCDEKQKAARGCAKETKVPVIQIGDEKIYRCPYRLVKSQSLRYIEYYNYFRNGHWPNDLPPLLQPSKFLEAVGELNKIVQEESKE